MMDFMTPIQDFFPANGQEEADKRLFLQLAQQYGDSLLHRSNALAHITCSAFVLNSAMDRVLFIHHNIMQKWAWTGGHADGERDFLSVAMREASEETGIQDMRPLTENIACLDILPVSRHEKNGRYVGAHLHLNVSFILLSDARGIRVKPDENSDVRWFSLDIFSSANFSPPDVALYQKHLRKAFAQRKTP